MGVGSHPYASSHAGPSLGILQLLTTQEHLDQQPLRSGRLTSRHEWKYCARYQLNRCSNSLRRLRIHHLRIQNLFHLCNRNCTHSLDMCGFFQWGIHNFRIYTWGGHFDGLWGFWDVRCDIFQLPNHYLCEDIIGVRL